MSLLNALRARAGISTLLSRPDSNPKVAKNAKVGFATAVMHLAPGNMSGHEVCPKRSPGCTAACLHFAGSPIYAIGKNKARIARTQLLFADRNLFMNILVLEIAKHARRAARLGLNAAVRLNGTSDIVWEKKRFILFPEVAAALGREGDNVIALFPEISFYDYTAIPRRTPPANYGLTFSAKENNLADTLAEMRRGLNIAVVFFGQPPAEFRGMAVIDGDEHDYRPADPLGVIVGLKAKGVKGKTDSSGFVHTLEDQALAA